MVSPTILVASSLSKIRPLNFLRTHNIDLIRCGLRIVVVNNNGLYSASRAILIIGDQHLVKFFNGIVVKTNVITFYWVNIIFSSPI